MKDQEEYLPEETSDTQPHLVGAGKPETPLAGNQMTGDQQEAAHEKRRSSDDADSDETNPASSE